MSKSIFNLVSNNKIKELTIVSKETPLNIRNEAGDTPLMSAIRNQYVKIVEILLDNGADVNFSDVNGWYPIHFATQEENMDIVKLLTKHGAKIDQQDRRFGNTALFVAISKTKGRLFIDYFLKLGADIEIPNKVGITPAAFAERLGINLK